MNLIKHMQSNADVCIYEHTEELLIGSFFKTKPKAGSIIVSFTKRTSNSYYLYEVVEVLKMRDAKISSTSKYNPVDAYFELKVRNITNEASARNIDNSINAIGLI